MLKDVDGFDYSDDNDDDDVREREYAQEETVKLITNLESEIVNKQNLFVGAMTTLMDACYFHAPQGSSATHLILTAHQKVLEARRRVKDD